MKTILLSLILFVSTLSSAQWGYCDWTNLKGGSSFDYGNHVVSDAVGNTYVVGNYGSPSLTIGTETITNADNSGNSSDVFILKYDPSGNLIWMKGYGGTSSDYANQCMIAPDGNVYVIGSFYSSSIDFGGTILNLQGWEDGFLLKLDANGNELFCKSLSCSSTTYLNALYVTDNNKVLLGGSSGANLNYDGVLASSMSSNIFLLNVDDAGALQWSTFQDYGSGGINSIAVNSNDEIIVTGSFGSDSLGFGLPAVYNSNQSFLSTNDLFVGKFDSNGNNLWCRTAYGNVDINVPDNEYGDHIVVDANDNIYITGSYSSDSMFYDGLFIKSLNNASFGTDVFLLKMNSNGDAQELKGYDGTNFESPAFLEIVGDKLYIGGGFQSSMNFGCGSLNIVGTSDIFLAKLDLALNCIGSVRYGDNDFETLRSLAFDGNGNLYLLGTYIGTSLTLGSNSLNVTNGSGTADDFYLAKFRSGEVGISEEEALVFNIYPNPAKDNLFIESQEVLSYTVVGADGKLLLTSETTIGKNSIDISGYKNGMYFISVINADKVVTYSFVKQ